MVRKSWDFLSGTRRSASLRLKLTPRDAVCASGLMHRSLRPKEFSMQNLSCRMFAKYSTAAAAVITFLALPVLGADSPSPAAPAQDDKLQSEFLLDLKLEAQTPQNLGSSTGGRLIVPVVGGSFAGPRLKGTIISPGG